MSVEAAVEILAPTLEDVADAAIARRDLLDEASRLQCTRQASRKGG